MYASVRPCSVALVLADREQVGEHLARVVVVGECVDDGHRRVRGDFLDVRLRERAQHDDVDVALEHLDRVVHRLLARECVARPIAPPGARRARRRRSRRTPACASDGFMKMSAAALPLSGGTFCDSLAPASGRLADRERR